MAPIASRPLESYSGEGWSATASVMGVGSVRAPETRPSAAADRHALQVLRAPFPPESDHRPAPWDWSWVFWLDGREVSESTGETDHEKAQRQIRARLAEVRAGEAVPPEVG